MSLLATIIRTINDPKTIKSIANIIIIKPTDSGPNKIASIGIPKKPTLPITEHWASTAASEGTFFLKIATDVARK